MSSDWRTRGACTREDPELFFSEVGASRSIALHICLTHCPVLWQCAQDTAGHPPVSGVQGGVVYGRYRMPLRSRVAPTCRRCPQPAITDTGACGTVRGYGRHCRAGTVVCKPCRVAQAERQRYLASLRPPPPPDPDVPPEIAARRAVLVGDVR